MPIAPDEKNWTWVLDRPCPDCGFDASAFSREDVASMIRDAATSWQAVLARADAAVRASDDVWSPLEYGCHVRDVFRIYDERLALMLARDAPTFANWDQDATAVDDAYGEQDPAIVAVELDEAAARLADRFDGVEGAQWSLPGARSDGAHFSVESFARYMIHDPIHHLFDARAVDLGK